MKNVMVLFAALMFCSQANGQWKAQSGEMYDRTFRMAYVSSKNGTETMRIIRNIPVTAGKTTVNPYDQLAGQILLNKKIEKEYRIQCLVLRFDDSPKIYIHQPSVFKQGWDPNAGKYIIESDWKQWRSDDRRNKEVRITATDADTVPAAGQIAATEIIQLLKSHQRVFCQVVMMHEFYETQTIIDSEFILQNSTKSINFLFQ